jgi:gliding motility-associated-like protein
MCLSYQVLLAQGDNCSKYYFGPDTIISCLSSGNCITLKAIAPNIKTSTDDYKIVTTGYSACDYISPIPEIPGFRIDDRYSAVNTLPFTFSFYGSSYTAYVVGGNGIISFDQSKANTFCHYGILNSGGSLSATSGTPQTIPSTLFDRAVIMGPYHDINPNDPYNGSTDEKMQIYTYGTSPNRKTVISWYHIPLFSSACGQLLNTHQIVLHEGSGIIDVIIQDKTICPTWNQGRATLGIMNFARNKALAAPGKNATVWGTTGMNEKYQFIPSGVGPTAFKRIELYDGSTLVATGDTVGINNGAQFDVSFPNVCVASGSKTFTVRAFYRSVLDPNIEIILEGPLTVTRINPIGNVTVIINDATCTNAGTAVVGPVDPDYTYSKDSITFQSSNVFNNLSSGAYKFFVRNGPCVASAVDTVIFIDNLTLTAAPDTSVCKSNPVNLYAYTNASTIAWQPANEVTNPAAAVTTAYPEVNSSYYITATLGSCVKKDTVNVIVKPTPFVDAGPPITTLAGDQVQLLGTASAGIYLWTPGTQLSSTSIVNPYVISPQQTTEYTLNVTNSDGCSNNDKMILTVIPYCVKVMSAFTPNGDGINDLWYVTQGTTCTKNISVSVYNRYGSKVFESKNYNNDWNGRYRNSPLSDGTYYYMIEVTLINDRKVFLKGDVTILR